MNVRNLKHVRVAFAVLLGAVICMVSLVHSASSIAADRENTHRMEISKQRAHASFSLRATNGFKVTVSGSPRGVVLTAEKGQRWAEYFDTMGHAGENGIEADFGKLGRVSVEFRPNGRYSPESRDLAARCRPSESALDPLGMFVGQIRFVGENGFTKVDSGRAWGAASPQRVLRCEKDESSRGKSPGRSTAKEPSLSAVRYPFPLVSFQAGWGAVSEQYPLLDPTEFSSRIIPFTASTLEYRGNRLTIIRTAVAVALEPAFDVSADRNTAFLTPSAPFFGKAEFRNCARERYRWQGSLGVRFPGKTISLVGRKFGADLEPGGRCKQEDVESQTEEARGARD